MSAQDGLFGNEEWWEPLWRGMPEFVQEDLAPVRSIQVDFASAEAIDEFCRLVNQPITEHAKRTRSIWYPEAEIWSFANKKYVSSTPFLPRYPVYIISKGRWESRMTSRSLERINVPYYIVVEPRERADYAAVIDSSKILTLPFQDLGQGSIPARNFVWEHALSTGAKRHWILDDNIGHASGGFWRLNRNLKTPTGDATIFRCAEDFVDRYENIALAGFHYFMFASRKTKLPPFYMNTRIYSCILIQNDIPYRWRGRYNEDTDLSLRVLKDGWCTVLFSAFLCFKQQTMTMAGGNTEALYAKAGRKEDDGRWKMAESLRLQHPDVTKITEKWGRYQHQVDYSGFRQNQLRPRADLVVPEGVNDFGMKLEVDGKIVDDAGAAISGVA